VTLNTAISWFGFKANMHFIAYHHSAVLLKLLQLC